MHNMLKFCRLGKDNSQLHSNVGKKHNSECIRSLDLAQNKSNFWNNDVTIGLC